MSNSLTTEIATFSAANFFSHIDTVDVSIKWEGTFRVSHLGGEGRGTPICQSVRRGGEKSFRIFDMTDFHPSPLVRCQGVQIFLQFITFILLDWGRRPRRRLVLWRSQEERDLFRLSESILEQHMCNLVSWAHRGHNMQHYVLNKQKNPVQGRRQYLAVDIWRFFPPYQLLFSANEAQYSLCTTRVTRPWQKELGPIRY